MSHFVAEIIGTMMLVSLVMLWLQMLFLTKQREIMAGLIAITTGWAFAVALPVYIFGGISGAHFNPALTLGFATIDKFPMGRCSSIYFAQMIGGISWWCNSIYSLSSTLGSNRG